MVDHRQIDKGKREEKNEDNGCNRQRGQQHCQNRKNSCVMLCAGAEVSQFHAEGPVDGMLFFSFNHILVDS